MRVLILGGSSEASALARALAGRPAIHPVLSLAGRTAEPGAVPIPTRTGGFGGVAGLAAYLHDERIDLLIDATHPFAARMSGHARLASQQTNVPLIRVSRDAWRPSPGDQWLEVVDMAAAADALGMTPRRVFLTVGRLQLDAFAAAPWHHYLVRTIDPMGNGHGLLRATCIEARGPFTIDGEVALMREHGVDVLVTKNSGGAASAAKLEAARHLGTPVVLVRRPDEIGPSIGSIDAVIAAIEAHVKPPAPRGV